MAEHLTALEDSDARVVVIRGAGRAFSAGYDLSSGSEEVGDAHLRSSVADRDRQAAYIDRFTRIWRCTKPVIAQVHGYCMAGATQLALFCDITIVAEDTQIAAFPAIPLGGGFISPLWSFQVGPQGAKELSFVPGRRIDGRTGTNEASPMPRSRRRPREARPGDGAVHREDSRLDPADEEAGDQPGAGDGGLPHRGGHGADTYALIHTTPDVAELQELVKEIGLKEAISRFRG